MKSDRVAALEALFAHIGQTRMSGVPLLNEKLRVQAVGFEADADADDGEVGVLVTPWFMNLVWLPPSADGKAPTAVGATRQRRVGNEVLPFIGAHEDGFGAFEACSLFSPMFEFVDQDAALATAQAVLDELRRPPPPAPDAPALASRRALLLGRSAAAGARP